MARKDELLELTKAELQELAEENDLSTEGNKGDIADRIVRFELGVAEPVEADEPEVEPVTETEEAEKAEPKDRELVKFVGRNASIRTHGHTFSRKHPFAAIEKDAARQLLSRSSNFRLANPDELEEYYG